MYIKGIVNTKDQSNVWNDVQGVKRSLIIPCVTIALSASLPIISTIFESHSFCILPCSDIQQHTFTDSHHIHSKPTAALVLHQILVSHAYHMQSIVTKLWYVYWPFTAKCNYSLSASKNRSLIFNCSPCDLSWFNDNIHFKACKIIISKKRTKIELWEWHFFSCTKFIQLHTLINNICNSCG